MALADDIVVLSLFLALLVSDKCSRSLESLKPFQVLFYNSYKVRCCIYHRTGGSNA